MRTRTYIKITALLSLVLFAQNLEAQRVSDVEFHQEGDNVKVYYNLSQDANVLLYVSTDKGQSFTRVHAVSGNVGANVAAGKDRCIIWNVLADRDSLVSDKVVFRVEAMKIKAKLSQVAEKVRTIDQSKNIVLLNFLYGREPQYSYGFTYIYEKRFGFFVSAESSFDFDAVNTSLVCDRGGDLIEGYDGIQHGSIPFTDEVSRTQYGFQAGLTFRIHHSLGFQIGAGYGYRVVGWKLQEPFCNENWVRCGDYEVSGLQLSVGTHVCIKRLSFAFDVVTTKFQRTDIKFGLGINF